MQVNTTSLKQYIENISYKKELTYTQEEVLSILVDAISNLELIEIVDSLPLFNIKDNKIYLVLNNLEMDENSYDVYVHCNGVWERIDGIDFNISDYYNKSNIDNLLTGKSDVNHIHNIVDNEYDGFMSVSDKEKLDNIESNANHTITDTILNSSSNNPISNQTVYNALSSKADNNHSSEDTIYGVGSVSRYGHVKAGDNVPLMDGTGSSGSDDGLYARADHVHPTDTSRASKDIVTTESNGLMSSSDKVKLDNIESYLNSTFTLVNVNSTNELPDLDITNFSSYLKYIYYVRYENEFYVPYHKPGTSGFLGDYGVYKWVTFVHLVDNSLNSDSNNLVTNRVITNAINNHKQSSSSINDTNTYNNINPNTTTQESINQSVNNIIGDINSSLSQKANSNDVYTKQTTYTKSEINDLITNSILGVDLIEVVDELPVSDISHNKLYLKLSTDPSSQNIYDIYIRVNDAWEQIDKFNVNLENYYDKDSVDTLLDGKVDNTDSRLTNARTPLSHAHGNIQNTGKIGTSTGEIIITDNGLLTTGNPLTSKIKDSNNYPNIGSSANETQESINSKINNKLGEKLYSSVYSNGNLNIQ